MDFDGSRLLMNGSGTFSTNLPGTWVVPKHYVGKIHIFFYVSAASAFGNSVVTISGFDQTFTFPMNANGFTVNNPQSLDIEFNNYLTALPRITAVVTGLAVTDSWVFEIYTNKNA